MLQSKSSSSKKSLKCFRFWNSGIFSSFFQHKYDTVWNQCSQSPHNLINYVGCYGASETIHTQKKIEEQQSVLDYQQGDSHANVLPAPPLITKFTAGDFQQELTYPILLKLDLKINFGLSTFVFVWKEIFMMKLVHKIHVDTSL